MIRWNFKIFIGSISVIRFEQIDINDDGRISYNEFEQWSKNRDKNIDERKIKILFQKHDKNSDSILNISEFVPLAFTLSMQPRHQTEQVFKVILKNISD